MIFIIEVLENNKEKVNKFIPYPRELICEGCGSKLAYGESDLRMGEYGCVYIDCPICGCNNMLDDDEHSITLTVDNIRFPIHFHHVNKESGSVDVFNEHEIKKYIRKAINFFRSNKDEYDYGGWITGNLFVHVSKCDGDEFYEVTVSNDFYNMEIPFEKEDYK